jgi:glutamate racemase
MLSSGSTVVGLSINHRTHAAPIGVFDSGLGGLSVLREIRDLLPHEDLVYVADSGAAPYGDRTGEFIEARAAAIATFLIGEGAKAMVVACNTATAVAVRALRERFAIPIVAIEPAVKPAAAMSKSGVIGVMATSLTLASENFRRLAEQYAQGARIVPQPCPGLVELVEGGRLAGSEVQALVAGYVLPLVNDGVDTIVLGCTHYPFLLPVIREVAGPAVNIIDPARAVASELRRRLEAAGLLVEGKGQGGTRFLTSGAVAHVEAVLATLWGRHTKVESLPAQYTAPA